MLKIWVEMQKFDLAISYKWIYDKDFVKKVEVTTLSSGISIFIIHEDNIDEVTELLKKGTLKFKAYLDRASDEDVHFEETAQLVKASGSYIFNHYDVVDDAIDKSVVHKKLLAAGFNLPDTIIIPPLDNEPEIETTQNNLNKLGIPFIIKPAYYSGGGEGINLDAKSLEDIYQIRKENSDDNYLVQEIVFPQMNANDRCWLRSFWFLDEAFPLWWDDKTHIYRQIDQQDYDKYGISKVKDILSKIAEITSMDYFSTEIAIDKNNEFVIIDYVNDQCDMRLKSKYFNGVPDKIVDTFIRKIIEKVRSI